MAKDTEYKCPKCGGVMKSSPHGNKVRWNCQNPKCGYQVFS